MKNVNKVFLLGNVSREPEIKKTASGKKVAIFGIATNRDWTVQDSGEKQSLTEFHNCVAWGRLAELCESYLSKGKLVYAEGYLKTRSWEDEYGKKQFRTEVVLMEIIILEKFSRKDDGENDDFAGSNEDYNDEYFDDLSEETAKNKEKSKPDSKQDNTDTDDNDKDDDTDLSKPLFDEEEK